jgi:hypothetical protein
MSDSDLRNAVLATVLDNGNQLVLPISLYESATVKLSRPIKEHHWVNSPDGHSILCWVSADNYPKLCKRLYDSIAHSLVSENFADQVCEVVTQVVSDIPVPTTNHFAVIETTTPEGTLRALAKLWSSKGMRGISVSPDHFQETDGKQTVLLTDLQIRLFLGLIRRRHEVLIEFAAGFDEYRQLVLSERYDS